MDATTPATMLADRALLRLAGDDVRGFLQGLVTNDTALLAPDMPVWTALLTPQGKVLFDFIKWDDGAGDGAGSVLVDCEATQAAALAKRLSMYRLRRAITIEPDARVVHWAADGAAGVPDPRLAALGRRWIGAAGPASTGWQAHRLAHGVTEGVAELGSGETLWLECNAAELNGVSFAKGCYVGQENTARMHYRAKVNRRLFVTPLAEPGERTRVTYPALGLMVEWRRVEDRGNAIVPDWLAAALAVPVEE